VIVSVVLIRPIDAMCSIKSSDVNDTDISFISRNNLEMSSVPQD
jgi:hypothetical protein